VVHGTRHVKGNVAIDEVATVVGAGLVLGVGLDEGDRVPGAESSCKRRRSDAEMPHMERLYVCGRSGYQVSLSGKGSDAMNLRVRMLQHGERE